MSKFDHFITLLDKYTVAVEKRKDEEFKDRVIDNFLPYIIEEHQAREALIIDVIEHYKFN